MVTVICAAHQVLVLLAGETGEERAFFLLPQTKVCFLTSGERISQINLNPTQTIAVMDGEVLSFTFAPWPAVTAKTNHPFLRQK